MMLFPWRSSARALFRTSNAVSVPSRDMRRASCSSYCVALSMAGKLLKDANGLLYARILRVLARTTGVHSAFLGGAFVDSYLSELYGHQEWADAEHWHAF